MRLAARRTRPRHLRFASSLFALAGVAAAALALAPSSAAAPKPKATTMTVTAATGSAPDSRALWVWDTSTPAATVDFAVSTGVDQLFVAVPPNVTTSSQLPNLRTLADRARAAGIRVIMITGDHPRTAARIAADVGIVAPGAAALTGAGRSTHLAKNPSSSAVISTVAFRVIAGALLAMSLRQ